LRKWFYRFLVTLNERFQIDARYFLIGSFWLFLPTLMSYVLGLVRSIAFARLLEQNTYGELGFVNSVAGTVGILTLPGINTALVETVARGNLGALADALHTRTKWGILGSLVMTGVSLYYVHLGHYELVAALLIAGAFLPLVSAFQVVQAYYNGLKRFHMVSLISGGIVLLNTVSVLLILWLQKGLVWLVIATNGSQLIFLLTLYQLAARHAKEGPRDSEMVAYGRSLTWIEAISSVAFYLDGVVLGFTTGFTDVAVYTIAAILPENIKNLMKMLVPLAIPKIAEQPEKRVYTQRTRRHLLALLVINLIVVLLTVVTIPIVISLLYGQRYATSIFYAQLLMLSLAAGWPGSFFTAALQARKRAREIYQFNLIYGILQVGTLLLFVPLWGILGIVLSRIVTRLGSTLYQWYAVTKI
jgi:O-antigen/teichoic acid export membrane protein